MLQDELTHALQASGLAEVKFSDTWPPALILPEDGLQVEDIRSFIESILVSGLGYLDAKDCLEAFLHNIPTLRNVYLTRFEVDLDEGGGNAFFVGFQLKESWTLLSESGLPNIPALVLSDPGFTIGSPGADGNYMLNVYGTLEIFGVTLQVTVQWPAMIITGSLVHELDLQTLLAEAGFEEQVKFGDKTAGFKISALLLKIDLNNKAFDFTFGLGGWEILPDKLLLNNLLLDLSIGPGYKSASLRAQMALCGIDFDLSGKFQDGQLEFSGSTGLGQKLPIGQFIAGLNELFGTGADVPTAISSLAFDDLSLAFNTGDASRIAFKGNATLEVDGTPVRISVGIDVTGKEKKIGAQVIIGGELFMVTFDGQKASVGDDQDQDYETALIALYEHDAGKGMPAPNLRDMVEPLSPSLSRAIPAIEIHKAIFGYHSSKQKGKTTSAWLFGVELGAINLSVGDPSQPIVSALIGNDLSFGVESPQLLLTTRALKHDVLASLPSLGDKFKLPASDLNAACLSASLTLGEQKYPLMLNLGEVQEKEVEPVADTIPAGQEAPATDSSLAPAARPAPPAEQETTTTTAPAGDVTWVKVQKQVSVLYFEKIGIRFKNGSLGLFLSASLTTSGLTITLDGFSIESPLDRFQPSFNLSGLGLTYKADPVEVSGAFLKSVKNGNIQYSGQALVKAKSFLLAAFGSYAIVEGNPSLFIFAFLDAELGGPPCFFVTGLAAGFGYNTTVRKPAIEQVKDFPLLAAMNDPDKIGGKDASPMKVLSSLGEWIEPQPGTSWLAAGVSFRSFEIIKSDVLVIAEFGKEFQALAIGFSTIQLPQKGSIYAYAELMIQVTVKPAEGVIAAMAQLTPNSYLLDPACHLTGGFAFFVWFGDNLHAGDFVLTIGGYHPAFKAPAWYPQVPRLGFNWLVSKTVTIKGEAYFALTPSCVMAGGALDVLYQSGNLKAWFIAHADLILFWNPFYFEANISIRVGVSYRIKVWFVHTTLSVELGAGLELWGPPTGGRVHINWCIISFTVSFGADRLTGPKTVNWAGFKTMLPQKKKVGQATAPRVIPREAVTIKAPQDTDLSVIQINVNTGLLQQADGKNDKKRWIIRPDEFAFSVESAIPLTEAQLAGAKSEKPISATIGIRPMGISSSAFTSQQTITIQKSHETESASSVAWVYECHTRSLPEAMWGSPVTGSMQAEAKLIDNCLVGLKNVRPQPPADLIGPPEFLMDAFAYFPVDLKEDDTDHQDYLPLSREAKEPEARASTSNESLSRIQATLMAPAISEKRTGVYKALGNLGVYAWTDGDLQILAANPAASLQASPMIGSPVPESR